MLISKTQVKHRLRNIQQRILPVTVGVIGGYHGGNLGDMALGASVIYALQEKKISSGLQTIYNISKWPQSKFAIVGGGAVGYIDSLTKVAHRYKGNFEKVALLGVDFNEKNYSDECIDLIRNAAYVSGRSQEQAERLTLISGRTDIKYHPDIAFSLYRDFCLKNREKRTQKTGKKLMVNVVPLYGKMENGNIVPSEQYRSERPELYASFEKMHASYKKLVRDIVIKAASEGFEVETISFTPQDGEYARLILEGLAEVRHLDYQSDPYKMIKHMSGASMVLATRYHATIFALKLGIPLFPVAYAVKNELLLQELGVNRAAFLSTGDLANGLDLMTEPVTVDPEKIGNYEMTSQAAINESIAALKVLG
ncbi:polysaccharide pyruvyl transferase family protein [Pedobacter metabolipauper]|uniref:Polysaccharide pyruvyl transferase n=1 Tax=Pedobacter metabolipauper TaxID=425513 RepID=A0A4R6SXQ6_9SPHI|nr:polysaccharide pyruvyl transferase family protein [Pedobacter metabolipauper]TDQ09983.1 polysaccharide pyruvyl transferase [Pedobacter metabolipauper]